MSSGREGAERGAPESPSRPGMSRTADSARRRAWPGERHRVDERQVRPHSGRHFELRVPRLSLDPWSADWTGRCPRVVLVGERRVRSADRLRHSLPHRWIPRVLQHDGRPREQLLERFRIERLGRSVDESERAIGNRHLRVPVDPAPLGSLAVVPVAGRATLDDRSARLVFTPQEATVALAGYARLVRRMYIHDIRYIIYAVGHCSRGRGNEDEDGEPRADQLESGAARKNCRGPRPRDTAQSNGGPTEHGSPAPEVVPRMGQHSVYP